MKHITDIKTIEDEFKLKHGDILVLNSTKFLNQQFNLFFC